MHASPPTHVVSPVRSCRIVGPDHSFCRDPSKTGPAPVSIAARWAGVAKRPRAASGESGAKRRQSREGSCQSQESHCQPQVACGQRGRHAGVCGYARPGTDLRLPRREQLLLGDRTFNRGRSSVPPARRPREHRRVGGWAGGRVGVSTAGAVPCAAPRGPSRTPNVHASPAVNSACRLTPHTR